IALALIFLLVTSTAFAHKVNIFAWIEGDTVYTESYFSGKKKVKNGRVEVFGPDGKKLLEGQTNEKGEFSFKVPQKTDLRIVLTASAGHKNDFILKAEGLPEEITRQAKQEKTPAATSQIPARADLEQIRAVVEETLDVRLRPIIRALAELKKDSGPGLTEIIGGIGYIFGIMGLVMYFRSRKKD
ncbi:MAG: hypothetical protein JRI34_06780, partial [Deltaproteobacteria bacterium]|nr:hypothetical protein [Deltaproteobacteria bacterium]